MKSYIIKLKDTQAYIKNINNKKINYTFDVKIAKRYEKQDAEKLLDCYKDFEAVEYNKELYKIKNERFKIFVKALLAQENTEIADEDIEIFQYEEKNKGILIACSNLKEKYSNNTLLDEMKRISKKIEYRNIYKSNPGKDISESYDYDDSRQMEILKLAFNEKYIINEIMENDEEEEEQ